MNSDNTCQRVGEQSRDIEASRSDVDFSLSIVSHGQAGLVKSVLGDLKRLKGFAAFEVVLTINVPEDEEAYGDTLSVVDQIIRNPEKRGFGANHNAAFKVSKGRRFVVVNPDIRLKDLSFSLLEEAFSDLNVGACAPVVLSSAGNVEDSFRHFPTIGELICKAFFGIKRAQYEIEKTPFPVDWAAGMFVAYRSSVFEGLGGFDERYFMYYEDADICRRLFLAGYKTVVQPAVVVIHDAQRDSVRNPRYFAWHLRSAIRFLAGF